MLYLRIQFETRTNATTVTVGPGVQPVVAWSPSCRAEFVLVDAYPLDSAGEFEPAWRVEPSAAGVAPPIQIGVPTAQSPSSPAIALLVGRQYRACVASSSGAPSITTYVACASFTP